MGVLFLGVAATKMLYVHSQEDLNELGDIYFLHSEITKYLVQNRWLADTKR